MLWDILSFRGRRQYGSYLWFFYMTQKFGLKNVAYAFQRAKKTDEPREAMNTFPAFNDTENNNEPGRFWSSSITTPGKLGGTYSLSFNILNPPLGHESPLHGNNWSKIITRNHSLIFGIPDYSNNVNTNEPIKNTAFPYFPNSVDINIAPNTKRIKGSDKFEIHPGVFGAAEWDYRRID